MTGRIRISASLLLIAISLTNAIGQARLPFEKLTEPFSINTGVLTATSKIVRAVAKRHYKKEIQAAFKSVGEEIKIE